MRARIQSSNLVYHLYGVRTVCMCVCARAWNHPSARTYIALHAHSRVRYALCVCTRTLTSYIIYALWRCALLAVSFCAYMHVSQYRSVYALHPARGGVCICLRASFAYAHRSTTCIHLHMFRMAACTRYILTRCAILYYARPLYIPHTACVS